MAVVIGNTTPNAANTIIALRNFHLFTCAQRRSLNLPIDRTGMACIYHRQSF